MPFKVKILHGIWIPLVKGGGTLVIDNLTSDTSIQELKERILERNQKSIQASLLGETMYFTPQRSSLMFAGKVLDVNRYMLSDYGVGPGSVLSFAHWYTFNVPLSAYKVKMFQKAFDEYDEDGSGEIDAKELRILMKELGMRRTEEQCAEMVDLVDEDGSGEIDFEEFCTMMVKVMQEDDGASLLEFMEAKGSLSEEELRKRDNGAYIMWDPGYPGEGDEEDDGSGGGGKTGYGPVRFDPETNSYVFSEVHVHEAHEGL